MPLQLFVTFASACTFTMSAAVANCPAQYEDAMLKCKRTVYKNRTRLKDFIMDFDKLRSGFVHNNHFL